MLTGITQGAICVVLFLFALLQINDPDPVVWTGFYALCFIAPLLALLKRPSAALYYVMGTGCVVVAGIYLPGAYDYYQHRDIEPLMQQMMPSKPYIEEAREFLGCLIALTLLTISYFLSRSKR
jgi:hypothetical protein